MLLLLAELEKTELAGIALTLLSRVYSCIAMGKNYKLPSTSQACVWKSFHQMRNSVSMRTSWNDFILQNNCLSTSESNLTLQLLLDRILKVMLHNEAQATVAISASTANAVRYMAGYVVISFPKKFNRPVKKAVFQDKRMIYMRVLSRMKAENQPTDVASLSDCTKLWSELIDRGGIYHISDEVGAHIHLCYVQTVTVHYCACTCAYKYTIMEYLIFI